MKSITRSNLLTVPFLITKYYNITKIEPSRHFILSDFFAFIFTFCFMEKLEDSQNERAPNIPTKPSSKVLYNSRFNIILDNS